MKVTNLISINEECVLSVSTKIDSYGSFFNLTIKYLNAPDETFSVSKEEAEDFNKNMNAYWSRRN